MVYIVALSFSPLGALQIGSLALDPLTLIIFIGLVYTPSVCIAFYLIFDSITKI